MTLVRDPKETIKQMPAHLQSQTSTTDQVAVLICAANKLGLYDAADLLTKFVNQANRN